jgi:hypothetical protein
MPEALVKDDADADASFEQDDDFGNDDGDDDGFGDFDDFEQGEEGDDDFGDFDDGFQQGEDDAETSFDKPPEQPPVPVPSPGPVSRCNSSPHILLPCPLAMVIV